MCDIWPIAYEHKKEFGIAWKINFKFLCKLVARECDFPVHMHISNNKLQFKTNELSATAERTNFLTLSASAGKFLTSSLM